MDKIIKYLNLNLQDIDADWNKVNKILMETAEQEIGLMKKKKNEWFNEVCRKAVEKRKLSRDSFFMLQDQNTKENYEIERRKCKHIIQKAKRKFLNGILEEAERNRSHGNTRNFFRIIKKHQHFNPSLKAIKNTEGCVIMEPGKKAERWREYFIELLNSDISANAVGRQYSKKLNL